MKTDNNRPMTATTRFERLEEKTINPSNVWEEDAFHALQQYADFLSKAMISNNKNFVLNVNGVWGSGKSFFVQRWAEDLRQKEFPVVEFNAWENDSMDDPLIPLVAEISHSLKRYFEPTENAMASIKKSGSKLLKLPSIAARGVTRYFAGQEGVDEIAEVLNPNSDTKLYPEPYTVFEQESSRMANRKKFITDVKTLISKLAEKNKAPLFIFIDELDRCRPLFAIELLERIKHLFNVAGIKFIISTDTEQLSHSVSGIYGERFNGAHYLQRFFDQTFTLPQHSPHQFAELLFLNFDNEQNWGNTWVVQKSPAYTMGEIAHIFELSLRQQQQFFMRLMTILPIISTEGGSQIHAPYLYLLIILRLKHQHFYKQLIELPQPSSQWHQFKEQQNLATDSIPHLDFYIEAMEKSSKDLMRTLNNTTRQMGSIDEATKRNNLRIDIFHAVLDSHLQFQKYPEYVELTNTIS